MRIFDFIRGVREGYSEGETSRTSDTVYAYRTMRNEKGKPITIIACGYLESQAIEFVIRRRESGWIISDPYWSRLSDDYRAGVWAMPA